MSVQLRGCVFFFLKKEELQYRRSQRETEGLRFYINSSSRSCPGHVFLQASDSKPAPSPSPDRGRFHVTWRCWGGRHRASGQRFPAESVPPSCSKMATHRGCCEHSAKMQNTGHFISCILSSIFSSSPIISILTPLTLLQMFYRRAIQHSLYLLLTILTAYFSPVFLCVQRLQIEKLPSPRTLSLRSIS